MAVKFGPGKIDVEGTLAKVADRGCGGVAFFLGVVRVHDSGRRVTAIEYQGYPSMAKKVLADIERGVKRSTRGGRAVLWHRTGRLKVGDASVLVAVSSPHRAEAFAACSFAIEELKREVPIWKKEVYEDGDVWVGLGP